MNILFMKERQEDTTHELLLRILAFLESFCKKNNTYPEFIKLSKRDLQRIKDYKKYNNTLINKDNCILGMKIITYSDYPYKKNKYNRRREEKEYEFARNR